MKTLITSLVIFTISITFAIAQCDTLYQLNTDKFNKSKSYTLKKPIISYDLYDKEKAIVLLTNISKNGIYFGINTSDNYCTDNDKSCLFLFEDDTVIEDKLINSFNCKGEFHFAIFNDKKNNIFFTKKIIAIRLFAINQTLDYELSEDVSRQLYDAFTCKYPLDFTQRTK